MKGSILEGGWLAGKKTYLTAAVTIATAVVAYLAGEMDLQGLIQAVSTAAIGAFLRAGVAKAEISASRGNGR